MASPAFAKVIQSAPAYNAAQAAPPPADLPPTALSSDVAPQMPTAQPNVELAPLANEIGRDRGQLEKIQWAQENPYGTANNHPGKLGKLAHAFSMIGNIAGDIFAPSTMALIPGTQLNRQRSEGFLANRLNQEQEQQQQEMTQGAQEHESEERTKEAPAKAASEEGLQGAQVTNLESEARDRDAATAMGPTLAAGYSHAVNEAIKEGRDPAQDPIVGHLADAITSLQKQSAPAKEANPQQTTYDDLIKRGMTPEQAYEKIREKPAGTTVNEGTWSLQTDTDGKPILFNSKTGQTREAPANIARKPNAEEIKRNDLAGNVNENLDKLEDIVTRRPELFGPIAGRMTSAKEMIGTGDPDVAALKTIEDNLGMAMQSAHGMRSAQHVATSAQSVLNGFKNSPQALSAAIKTARSSVGTFQHDVQNPNEAGRASTPPIVQHSPSTGQYRYSTDGGKTWQAGQPQKQ